MQLLLPIFPKDTRMLSSDLGVYEEGGFVYYLHGGLPIHVHDKDNVKRFFFFLCSLIDSGRCKATQAAIVFNINKDAIYQYLKIYREQGEEAFFQAFEKKPRKQKIHGEKLQRIQQMLDNGMSNYAIGKKENISEGTIRYALKEGKLKKNSQAQNL